MIVKYLKLFIWKDLFWSILQKIHRMISLNNFIPSSEDKSRINIHNNSRSSTFHLIKFDWQMNCSMKSNLKMFLPFNWVQSTREECLYYLSLWCSLKLIEIWTIWIEIWRDFSRIGRHFFPRLHSTSIKYQLK